MVKCTKIEKGLEKLEQFNRFGNMVYLFALTKGTAWNTND